MRWRPWRSLAERAARKDLLVAASLDEVEAYQAAVRRIVGVAPMLPAQPLPAEDMPPNAPDWTQRRDWPGNQPDRARLEDPRNHRGHW
jgi:hypothetical protein